MAGRGPANDEERLPWLEPQHRPAPSRKPAARRSKGGLIAVAAGLAVLGAAGGGYWFGQRDPAPSVRPPISDVALAPVRQAPAVPPAPAISPPAAEVSPPVEAAPAPAIERVVEPAPKEAARRAERPRKIRKAVAEPARQKQVRSAQRRSAPKRAVVARQAARVWPRMPSPGPAGQVIQLGAFRNPGGANRAYRTRLARYPALGSMPRVVVPVISKPRGQILYVLRLGTSSRQQSRIVCRNLRASGDHCLVIG